MWVKENWNDPRRGGLVGWRRGFSIGSWMFSAEHSTVFVGDVRYLERFILYVGVGTLRLHRFWRGDRDDASHTHPWWFITFPFTSYREQTYKLGRYTGDRIVKAWRPHFRAATFEHIVVGRANYRDSGLRYMGTKLYVHDERPFWTVVITGGRSNKWGFYPEPDHFVYWRDYK